MTLLFCDGFGHYTTPTQKWTISNGTPVINAAHARYGANGLGFGDTNHYLVTVFSVAEQDWVVGCAFRQSGSTNGNYFTVLGLDSGAGNSTSNNQVQLVTTQGRFYVLRGSTQIIAGTTVWNSGVWSYVEMKAHIHGTSGTVEMRVNGVQEGSTFSGNTANAGGTTADRLRLAGYTNGGGDTAWSDIYVCNQSGSYNNDFLGDIRVQSILPSGAGATTQMTPSAGSNYACVDEASPNGDTDYVSETTAGEKDTYAFGNLTPTSGTIKGVQILINARKDDAGTRSIAAVYGNGTPASDVEGATVSVSDSYTYYREIKEQDPVAAADWTISSVNSGEFGVTLKA